MERRSLPEVAVAALVAMAFFAALPLWFLSTQEGWVIIHCGGSPWVCRVQESNLLVRRTNDYLPGGVSSRREQSTGRGRVVSSWQLVFLVGSARVDVLRATTMNDELPALAADLERSRLIGEEVTRELAPDLVFWLALALVVLFAAAGAFIVLARGRAKRT